MNPQLIVFLVLAVVLVIGAGIFFQQRNGTSGGDGEADVDPPETTGSKEDAGDAGTGDGTGGDSGGGDD